ncbi:MAG: hypothetical protein SV377_05595, partial [Halobacteria archaeon]|nr:hypothetical protein [Halobacteria archaeon]
VQQQSFQRISLEDITPDITNQTVPILAGLADIPVAYGLPRDEGYRLPYVMPELDGAPLYEHENLKNVEESDLISGALVVRELRDLAQPPDNLPKRQHGTTLVKSGKGGGDYEYDLVPMGKAESVIEDFTGPQLSFEFGIPGFVEDRFAKHISTSGTPWEQPRFDNPFEDITDPRHRDVLLNRYYQDEGDQESTNRLFGVVQRMVEGNEGNVQKEYEGVQDESPDLINISLRRSSVESVALLESDNPRAVPTSNGVLMVHGAEPGEHRLTVNGPGYAPYSERFEFDGRDKLVGAEGTVNLVANSDAVKVRGDATNSSAGLARVRVTEDFAGTTGRVSTRSRSRITRVGRAHSVSIPTRRTSSP